MTKPGKHDVTALDARSLKRLYDKYLQEADELDHLHGQATTLVENLHRSGWLGKGSDKFYEEMEKQALPSLHRLPKAMKAQAEGMKKIAGIFLKAEEDIRGLIKQGRGRTEPSATYAGPQYGQPKS